jgi:hypothetical protein
MRTILINMLPGILFLSGMVLVMAGLIVGSGQLASPGLGLMIVGFLTASEMK